MKAKGGEGDGRREREPHKDSYGVDTDGRAMALGARRNIHVQSEYIREGANGTRGGRETRRRATAAWRGFWRMRPRPRFRGIARTFFGKPLKGHPSMTKMSNQEVTDITLCITGDAGHLKESKTK